MTCAPTFQHVHLVDYSHASDDAVNTYFRAVLAEQVRRADFEPKQYAQLANCQSPASQACDQESDANVQQLTFDSLPASVVEHVLQQTDLFTACSAAAASRGLRQVKHCGDPVTVKRRSFCLSNMYGVSQSLSTAPCSNTVVILSLCLVGNLVKTVHSTFQGIIIPIFFCQLKTIFDSVQAVESDMVWRTLFKRRWGDLVRTQHSTLCQSDTLRSCTDQHPEPSTWRETYRQRHLAEHSMQCPTCRQSKVVPIVYGFPSHLLVRNMRANKLRMGNDHLIEGQPIWTCTACAEEFTKFPYMSLELVCV